MKKNLTILACMLALILAAAALTGCGSSQTTARIIIPPETSETSADASAAGSEKVQMAAAATVNTVANAVVVQQADNTAADDAETVAAEPLSRGMEGDAIAALQTRLGELGYMDTVTGFYGRNTEQAVTDFQSDNGVEADGVVGSSTWALLFAAA